MENKQKDEKSILDYKRIIYTILYLIIGSFITTVVFVIVVIQFIFILLAGEANDKLLDFTAALGEYAKEMVNYVSFNTEEKPWPTGEWPK